jgi:hypothetical protein
MPAYSIHHQNFKRRYKMEGSSFEQEKGKVLYIGAKTVKA